MSQPLTSLQVDLEFHVEVWLKGPVSDLDEHQKHVEKLASLAGRDIYVRKLHVKEALSLTCFSTNFHAESPIDAMIMGTELVMRHRYAPTLKCVELRVVQRRWSKP